MISDFFDMHSDFRNGIHRHGGWLDRFPYTGEKDTGPSFTPTVDVEETSDAFMMSADLPGLNEDDIEIEITDKTLSISGERILTRNPLQQDDSNGRVNRTERRFGRFMRAFTIPDTVNSDEITADYSNGVLVLTLPKVEKQKSESRRVLLNQNKKQ